MPMTKKQILAKLREAVASGELDRRYEEARRESAPLLKALEESRHIDPAILHLRMTI